MIASSWFLSIITYYFVISIMLVLFINCWYVLLFPSHKFQGCTLRKITGSPKALNDETLGTQHFIVMQKVSFSSCPKAKVGNLRPLGTCWSTVLSFFLDSTHNITYTNLSLLILGSVFYLLTATYLLGVSFCRVSVLGSKQNTESFSRRKLF